MAAMDLGIIFKQKYVDFVVEEKLPYSLRNTPSANDNRAYIQIQKRNINTMDVLHAIMKATGLPRKKIGIAGLKDKHALAKQWLCFHIRDVAKLGEIEFLKMINQISTVIGQGFYHLPLNLSTEIQNIFHVRLKFEHKPNDKQQTEIMARVKKVYADGFPNLFGDQRFGFGHNNHRIGQLILEGQRKKLSGFERRFKLQAYASFLFNKYIDYRSTCKEMNLCIGDIVKYQNIDYIYTADGLYIVDNKKETLLDYVDLAKITSYKQPTPLENIAFRLDMIQAPVFGFNLMMSDKSTGVARREAEWMEHFELTKEVQEVYKNLEIFGIRRNMRVFPTATSAKRQEHDLLLRFTLPKSSYASVLVDMIEE